MTAKFALALVATTMFVAPALAADAVNSAAPTAPANSASTPKTPAASTPVASAPAASTNTAGKPAADTATKDKKAEVVHRHARHMMMAHNHKSVVKTATVTRSVKVVKSNQSAWPFGPFTWTAPGKAARTMKVAHHHAHHIMVAHSGKPSGEGKTVLSAKPAKIEAKPETKTELKTIAQAPAGGASTSDVKVIKADKDLKNGRKSSKDYIDTTRGQAAPSTPAGTTNKDTGKVN
jgi:hypothetical protein